MHRDPEDGKVTSLGTHRVISKPGACLRVVEIELNEKTARGLSAGISEIPCIRNHEKFDWWELCKRAWL